MKDLSLGRIDICYDRELREEDPSLEKFFLDSSENLLQKDPTRTIQYSLDKQTLKANKILSIFESTSANLDQTELELKKEKAKTYPQYFFQQDFLTFEKNLARLFYDQTSQLFDLSSPYLDWLVSTFLTSSNCDYNFC